MVEIDAKKDELLSAFPAAVRAFFLQSEKIAHTERAIGPEAGPIEPIVAGREEKEEEEEFEED